MLRALVAFVVTLPWLPFRLAFRWLRRPRGEWVLLRVEGRVVECAPREPFFRRFIPGYRPPTRVDAVRRLVRFVTRDKGRKGIVLELGVLEAGWATVESLVDALVPLEASGKQLVVHLRRGGGPKELLVALAGDRVLVAPPATFLFPGFGSSSLYAGAVLERLGVRFERFARSEYKTAYETAERTSMSEGQREQLGAVFDGLRERFDSALARRPGAPSRATLEERGILSADELVELGFASALAHEDELPAAVGIDPRKEKFSQAGAYFAHHAFRALPRFAPSGIVGVVPVRGIIADGDGPMGSEGVIAAIRALASERRVAAIVLHVDSPGGSALASELIHHEVVSAARHKPIVASFGDVSASGGYYVSAPASAIFARASTITGSIGVVAARPDASALVARLGFHRESVGDATHASLFDPSTKLEPASRAAFDRMLDASYARFVGVVAEGRRREASAIEPLARGRVYLASRALELGLVDGLGGYPAAVAKARELALARRPKLGRMPVVVVDPRRISGVPPLVPPAPAAELASVVALATSGLPLYLDADLVSPIGTNIGLPPDASLGLSSAQGVLRMLVRSLMSALFVVAAAACGGSLSAASIDPGPMPEGATYHGVWFSTEYGEMHLCQTNENVVGEYTHQERHGTVRGTVTGNLLRFEWREERNFVPGRPNITEGHGYFQIARPTHVEVVDGRETTVSEANGWKLTGRWGHDDSDSDGGPWTALLLERRSPDDCYNSIRRTAPSSGGSGEIQFADEGQVQPPPSPEP